MFGVRLWTLIVTVLVLTTMLLLKHLTLRVIDNFKIYTFIAQPGVVYLHDIWKTGHARAHPELCPELGVRLRLLILVESAPAHVASREAICYTWGQRLLNITLAIVLGHSSIKLKAALDEEDLLHGDLITGQNFDSYFNLPLKTLSMLEWVDTYCPRVPYILKADEDMFINKPRLLHFLSRSQALATRTIWGRMLKKLEPKRKIESKYYVSKKQFLEEVYPNFVTGPAYLLTADSVKPLLTAAAVPFTQYLPLEDVFVTGVLAKKADVTIKRIKAFYNRRCHSDPCIMRKYIAMHNISYHEQFDFWKKLNDNTTICVKERHKLSQCPRIKRLRGGCGFNYYPFNFTTPLYIVRQYNVIV